MIRGMNESQPGIGGGVHFHDILPPTESLTDNDFSPSPSQTTTVHLLQHENMLLRAHIGDLQQAQVDAHAHSSRIQADLTSMKNALRVEKSMSVALEQQVADERTRAEQYYEERRDYKQRLKEAGAAYYALKESYQQLKLESEEHLRHHQQQHMDPFIRALVNRTSIEETPVDDMFEAQDDVVVVAVERVKTVQEGSPTQPPPGSTDQGERRITKSSPSRRACLMTQHHIGAAKQQPLEEEEEEDHQVKMKWRNSRAPPRQQQQQEKEEESCLPTTEEEEEDETVLKQQKQKQQQQKRRSSDEDVINGVRRPAWKKAVRLDGDGFDNPEEGHARRSRYVNKRKIDVHGDDDGEDEDVFHRPPAKKWLASPKAVSTAVDANNSATATAGLKANDSIDTADVQPPPPPQQQQQQRQIKHQQVIRQKDERAKLDGFECADCKRFYDALQRWGAVAVGGLPQCEHDVGKHQQQLEQQQNAGDDFRKQLRGDVSRHRYLYEPPPTPVGFWNLGFTPPEEEEEDKPDS